MERELSEDYISILNQTFRELVASGRISKTSALREEADEPDLRSKPPSRSHTTAVAPDG